MAASEPDVGEQLDEIGPPHRCFVDEVLALAAAVQPPRDRDLAELELRKLAVRVVEQELDLAPLGRGAACGACEEDVVGLLRAQLRRQSDPEAQSKASETFDFPDPFGPTTTATPRSRRTSTGSGNDLKPRSLIALRCKPAER